VLANKAEKARRKELLNANREGNRSTVRNQLPVGAPVLKRLFDHHADSQRSTFSLRPVVD
jgi:hypothetical protein